MKKTIFAIISAVSMCCGNIINVSAADSIALFKENYDKYNRSFQELEEKLGKSPTPSEIEDIYKEIDELNAQFKKEQSPLVFNELIRASRNPLPKEFEGVRELIALVQSRGIKVDGVRFMDAISLANYLTDSKIKSEMIPMLFLASKRACTNFIQTHFNRSSFSSESFRSKVQKIVEQGCTRSKLFRDLFVTTFGKISSGSSRVSSQVLVLSGGGRTF